MSRWTPDMQQWLDEALSRATPLTVFQENAVKVEFRKIDLAGTAA